MFPIIPPFASFTAFTPTMPKFYWDIKDKEQMIKHICWLVNKVCKYADELGINVNEYREYVVHLTEEFEKFKESGFNDYYYEQILKWVENNMPEIIGMYIKMVFFGLTEDGYFVAYIPDGSGWDDIIFDTIMDYSNENYGHLTLNYDVINAQHSVNQGGV